MCHLTQAKRGLPIINNVSRGINRTFLSFDGELNFFALFQHQNMQNWKLWTRNGFTNNCFYYAQFNRFAALWLKMKAPEKMCHLPDLKKPGGQLEFIKNLRMSRQCRRRAEGISTTTAMTQTRKLKMSCVGRHSIVKKIIRSYHYLKSLFKNPCNNHSKSQTSLLSTN